MDTRPETRTVYHNIAFWMYNIIVMHMNSECPNYIIIIYDARQLLRSGGAVGRYVDRIN